MATGIKVGMFAAPAGVTTMEPQATHLLGIHVGPPVRASCRCDGLTHDRWQTEGDIDLVPAGFAGAWEDDRPATMLLLRLSPGLVRSAAEGLGLDPDRVRLTPQFQLRDPQIQHVAWALRAEHAAGHPGGRLYADSLGLGLSAHLLHRYAERRRPAGGLPPRRLARVLEHVAAHLDQDLSLADLAAVAGFSPSHFKTLFKQSTGQAVHGYVVQARVALARRLLLQGEMPPAQVALAAGFAHQSHMARCMRRVLGAGPREILRQRQ